jgi:hypothetical protein
VLAIKILVEAVEITRSVLEQQRRRPVLSSLMTTPEKTGVFFRVLHIDTHDLVPPVGYAFEMPIEGGPEFRDDSGQGIAEVLVLAPPKAEAFHDDVAAEVLVHGVKGSESIALF